MMERGGDGREDDVRKALGRSKAKFSLGFVVTTLNARETLNQIDVLVALVRHERGDWGDMCAEDRQTNNEALQSGEGRLFSAYRDRNDVNFWIITESDRSKTTILLPEDY
jgi:hypothetical protein